MIAALLLLALQDGSAAQACPYDRVVPLEITATDPVLEGHGPSKRIQYASEFSGTLHVWTKVEGDLDTFLRVENASGTFLAEDDDSGGKPTPCVKLEVEPGKLLVIVVAASKPGGTRTVELHLLAAPETVVTLAAASKALEDLKSIQDRRQAGSLDEARARITEAIQVLHGLPGAERSLRMDAAEWLLAFEASRLRVLHPCCSAWRACLDRRERLLPGTHPDVLLARNNLAETLRQLGDLAPARRLQEEVLDLQTRLLPDDHPDLQRARENLGLTLGSLGDLKGQRALEEKVLEVRSRTLPADDPALQTARQNLAIVIAQLGDLERAQSLVKQVLEVRSRTLPEDDPDLQSTRFTLANTIYVLGDFRAARDLYRKVLDSFLRTLPADAPQVQGARQGLAIASAGLGDLRGALSLQEQVLDVVSRTLPEEHPEVQAARLNVAVTAEMLGDLTRARAIQEKVLESYSRILPDDHPNLQMAREHLAVTLGTLGDLQGARELLEKVFEIRSRTLPDDHPDLQATRQNLAFILQGLGDIAQARELAEKVLEIWLRTLPDDHPHVQLARANLAASLLALGDRQGARSLQEEVLEVQSRALPDDDPALQLSRQNLAGILAEIGETDAALQLEEKVLDVRSKTLPANHPYLRTTRGEVALLLALSDPGVRTGRPAGAGKAPGEEEDRHRRFETLARNFAVSLRRSAVQSIADSSSREAEERIVSDLADLGMALSFAAGLGVFAEDPSGEEEAFLASETMRSAALASARLSRRARSEATYAEQREQVRAATDELARLTRSGATADELEHARDGIESAERGLVRVASRISPGWSRLVEPDLGALGARLKNDEALVAYRRYERTTIEPGDPPRNRAVLGLCAFVLRPGRSAPSNAGATPSVEEVPARERLERVELGPMEPIEHAVERWREALGTSPGRGTPVGVAPARDETAPGEDLRKMVIDPLREHLLGVQHVIVALDDVLNAVALDALPAGEPMRTEVEKTPDVRRPRDSSLLGEHLRIDVRLSWLDLLLEDESPPDSTGLLALGGPDFGSATIGETPSRSDSVAASTVASTTREAPPAASSSGAPKTTASKGVRSPEESGLLRGGAWERGFEPLPGTLEEVAQLGANFEKLGEHRGEIVVLHGLDASREKLFRLAPRVRFLHVATHGWFAPDAIRSSQDPKPPDRSPGWVRRTSDAERTKAMNPMLLCGLALAGANLPADRAGRIPGLVTAEELSTLDLSNCELAVLSACDTNVGLRRAGQGVASLQKALHIAGARSVITSLWKVPDEATKGLMLDFYRRLWVEKKPKWQALWEAKMKIRNEKDEAGRPRYSTRDWAAWVLTGDPN
jgi:tetratricopeptide (TPR) repeat protein